MRSASHRFLPLMPLQEAVQVVAQLHLGLEDVRLHALADGVAGFGHLDHLLPELFISLGDVIAAVGQGQVPICWITRARISLILSL